MNFFAVICLFADEELFQKSQQHNAVQFCQWAKSLLSFLAEKQRELTQCLFHP